MDLKKESKKGLRSFKMGTIVRDMNKNMMNEEIPRPGGATDGTKVFCFVCRGAEA